LRAALLAGRRRGLRGTGAPALRQGDGYEFSQLREYVDGDDPRRIDWAAAARAGAMQTRVVLEERALVLAVALDASPSMSVGRTRTNYDLAREAASVWFAAATDEDRCARLGAAPLFLRDTPGRTGARVCAARGDDSGELEPALRASLALVPRGARLLVVSDFFELGPLLAALRACVARFDVTTLFARDPYHEDLPLAGFVRLRDAESGRVVRAYVDRAARARYHAAVIEREGRTLDALRAAGMRVAWLAERDGAEAALGRAFHIA